MNNLRADERVSMNLRGMYRQYGYLPYKVSKFEEYDLYMRNKAFLESENVLAFSDMDGKLMALKPDVTLSIIKNTKDDGNTLKLCYAEQVYRVPRGAKGFKEITQAGLEVIGSVDAYTMGEVLMLAAKSLQAISADYALDVADLGIVSGILASENLNDTQRAQLLAFISDKNLHGLKAQCDALGVAEETKRLLGNLVTVYGPFDATLKQMEEMGLPPACDEALGELREILSMMQAYGVQNINLDFSVVNDMNYYNGLIFAGFIAGIPSSVLSGGRYDYLMQRMGRTGQAIGFAVYLDQLRDEREAYDVDWVIRYNDATQSSRIISAVQAAKEKGLSVRVQRACETPVRSREVLDLSGEAGK